MFLFITRLLEYLFKYIIECWIMNYWYELMITLILVTMYKYTLISHKVKGYVTLLFSLTLLLFLLLQQWFSGCLLAKCFLHHFIKDFLYFLFFADYPYLQWEEGILLHHPEFTWGIWNWIIGCREEEENNPTSLINREEMSIAPKIFTFDDTIYATN
jgi:hypothetical protein